MCEDGDPLVAFRALSNGRRTGEILTAYLNGDVAFRLPDGIKEDDEVSLIVRVDRTSVMDAYGRSDKSMTLQEYAATDEAKAVVEQIAARKAELLTLFDEQGNCFCSMERCWFKGEGDFRKPISCWLYPIRITQLSNGTRALNLHRWHICQDAFAKGKKEKVRVYEFLREPIERYFGEDFYSALSEAAKMLNADS